MPLVKSTAKRKHAKWTRLKKRTRRALMFLVVILAATYLLNFFFSFSSYLPKFYEPKDFEREKLMRKLDQFTGSQPAQAPGQRP